MGLPPEASSGFSHGYAKLTGSADEDIGIRSNYHLEELDLDFHTKTNALREDLNNSEVLSQTEQEEEASELENGRELAKDQEDVYFKRRIFRTAASLKDYNFSALEVGLMTEGSGIEREELVLEGGVTDGYDGDVREMEMEEEEDDEAKNHVGPSIHSLRRHGPPLLSLSPSLPHIHSFDSNPTAATVVNQDSSLSGLADNLSSTDLAWDGDIPSPAPSISRLGDIDRETNKLVDIRPICASERQRRASATAFGQQTSPTRQPLLESIYQRMTHKMPELCPAPPTFSYPKVSLIPHLP
ncbi:unnamed protein product [Protopolystoma xenopodis]|uniref:Uncharacterized protein n=1 Tax=Protopolystoma xenopodis TaxID=117903 RepID=A0A448WRA1_9PLAT|nr:unnamed protein product [Protopolystoma xenopodis]